MTPPAATAAARDTLRARPVPRRPRRISGPARAPRVPSRERDPLAVRLGRAAMRVGDARLLDRLVRGRAWIALLAIGLMGIVFMQVSLLRLNAGISRAVTAADTLDRQNSLLRADISRLDSGERIQDVAAKLGMVLPPAGDVHYLDGREADGRRAAASIRPPSPMAATANATASATPATGAPAAATAAATTTAPAQGAATGAAASTPATTQGAATGPAASTPAQGAATGAAASTPATTQGAATGAAAPAQTAPAATAGGATAAGG
jgi:cell division protein FtsL